MKKVILFTSSHKIGLTGIMVEWACCIRKYAYDRFLFVSGEREQFPGLFNRLDDYHIVYEKIGGLDDHKDFLRLVYDFKKHLDTFKPNVVHVHTNWQLAIVVFAKYIYRKKYKILYEIHGYRHNYRFRSLIARYLIGMFLYLFADKVINTSSFLKKKFYFLGKKNEIIYYGIDEDFFIKNNLPSFMEDKCIVFPGEFRTGKNQDLLIRTIKRYIDKTGDNAIKVYLPGKGINIESCKTLCKKLGIEDKVFFPGFLNRSEMLKLYLQCQFAIIPTNVETFGICIAEPFVLGRIVISRHVGVADDIIIHGETGFLFNSEAELLKILFDVLPNKELCTKVSNNAFNNRDIFRWDNISKTYLELIENLN